jgi:hypothetical protein
LLLSQRRPLFYKQGALPGFLNQLAQIKTLNSRQPIWRIGLGKDNPLIFARRLGDKQANLYSSARTDGYAQNAAVVILEKILRYGSTSIKII